MANLPQQTGKIQRTIRKAQLGKIGVESLWGFGDLCFNIPLMEEIAKHHNTKIDVAISTRCQDAVENLPFVNKTVIFDQLGAGIHYFENNEYEEFYQITQNVKFYEFKQQDPNHSLINTPLMTGQQLGLPNFDQKPKFYPTDKEVKSVEELNKPKTIAVESVYNSIQSWAQPQDIDLAVQPFLKDHHILWLSNANAPSYADDMLRYSRRECICALQYCDVFVSVGSGFFCACLGLPHDMQPKHIICLWKDDLYKYEEILNQKQWHPKITWVHNRQELEECITKLQC